MKKFSGFTLAAGATHVTKLPVFPKAGFTLAEVLITLGIIGVVAAITIPVLVTNYQERQVVTKLKKNYSLMAQVFRRAQDEDLVFETEECLNTVNGKPQMSECYNLDSILHYLTVVQDCGREAKGCFDVEYKTLAGPKERDFEHLPRYKKFILADGTSIAMESYNDKDVLGEFWIDVNGKRKPNVVGKDIFLFIFNDYNVYPYQKDIYKNKVDTYGHNAANWVLQNGNLNYLHKKK